MHIDAVCPFCRTTIRVNPELRGQQLRCVSSNCRRVFTVEDKRAPAPAARRRPSARIDRGPLPAEGPSQQSGSVGDLVPILPTEPAAHEPPAEAPAPSSNHVEDLLPLVEAEFAEPDEPEVVAEFAEPDRPQPESPPYDVPPPDAPAAASSWREPPPVRRGQAAAPVRTRGARPPAEEAPAPEAPAEVPADGPLEMAPGTWEPPPVRHPGALEGETVGAPAEGTHADQAPYHHDEPIHPRRRRWPWVVAPLLLLFVVAALGGGGWLVYTRVLHNEADLAREADAEYQEGKFRLAADHFQALATGFTTSANAPRYQFMQQLADYRARVGDTPENTGAALDLTEAFLRDHNTDPQLQAHARDVGQTLVGVLKQFSERNAKPDSAGPLGVIARAESVLAAVTRLNKKGAILPAEEQAVQAGFANVRREVALWQHRQEVMQQLARMTERPSAGSIEAAKRLLKAEEANFPGISQAADVVLLMNKLFEGHQASVVYVPAGGAGRRPARAEDLEPSVLFDPLVGGTPGGAPPNDAVVLALARGVLYALKRSNGEVKWTMRVGIDTAALPVTVPARVGSRERILVLSADTETLTAVDADGNQLWAYRLSKPCLGRPVVVGQLAYLPTYDGWVHEIELAEGRLVGRYNLGQALTMGGAREGKTSRVYFPADDSCVYVLDVAERRCVGVLYSGHPADSLRSEPIVIAPDNESPRFLVLNQKRGYEGTELKVFELPLADRNAAPLALDPRPRLAGWTWSRPYHDDEKVVMLTDQGVLGLFGVRQANNQDPALFPLLQPGGLKLDTFLPPEAAGRARAQVVHVQGDDVWVLAYGQLQRLQLAWSETEGLKPVAVWSKPRELGSPLHSSQVLEDRATGRATLVLVTQPLAQQTCLATAVDDETGTVLWQRQLGLVCQGEPLEMAPPGGGPPLLLALDQGGGLYVLDPQRFPPGLGAGWQSGGQGVLLARPLDENPSAPPVLALAPDGQSAYEIAAPGNGKQLVVRHVQWGAGRQLGVTERKVPLTSPLRGTPAVVGTMLVLPLADGTLGRLRLPLPAVGAEGPEGGPDWRSRRAPPDARGAVVALGPDRFLTTDGALGVTVWQWPPGAGWGSLPPGRDPPTPTLELQQRVVGTPLVLPAAPGGRPRVCVAGANGQVALLAPTPDGGLEVQRTWEMGKPMTTGPFLCRLAGGAVRVGCLAGKDNSQLAWLDPDRADVRWRYATPKGEAIVGLPQRAEELLIVADGSGRFVGLDVETGQAEGPGYALRGSVAPAVGPVPFGPGRLFTSLSDGTALLLPLNYFRHPLRGLRLGW